MTTPDPDKSVNFAYLEYVLNALCEVSVSPGDGLFIYGNEEVEAGAFRITLESGCALVVDANRDVVDDPEGILPERFHGRLPLTRRYRVTSRDEHDQPVTATVKASSRRFARLFARAPANAYVERV